MVFQTLFFITTFSIPFYCGISNSNNMEGTSLFLFISLIAIALCGLLVVSKVYSQMYDQSSMLLKVLMPFSFSKISNMSTISRGQFKRVQRSVKCLRAVRVEFFGSDYFEASTSLILFDFSMGCATNLILL